MNFYNLRKTKLSEIPNFCLLSEGCFAAINTRGKCFCLSFCGLLFVGYASIATLMRLWIVPAGFVACVVFAMALLGVFGCFVRRGTRAMKKLTPNDGIVIYPDLRTFAAACAAVLILVFGGTERFALAYFASIAACVLFVRFKHVAITGKKRCSWLRSSSLPFP